MVLADDPRRTDVALSLWQSQQGSSLWVLGSPSLQRASLQQLRRRGLQAPSQRYRTLMQGDDTVGQLTALRAVLPAGVCWVVLVTDRAHRDRALAIARLTLGGRGLPVVTPNPALLPAGAHPEDPRRLWRDVLRVQIWRATSWDGRSFGLWWRRQRS